MLRSRLLAYGNSRFPPLGARAKKLRSSPDGEMSHISRRADSARMTIRINKPMLAPREVRNCSAALENVCNR